MSTNDWQRSASIFLFGLGVGAGLGVLFAPKPGEETRDDIAGAVRHGADGVIAQGTKVGRRAQRAYDDAKEHVKGAVEIGGQAYREAKGATS